MKVMAAGFEPATVCLEGRCSIQLSYESKLIWSEEKKLSGRQDSNLRPSGPKPDALPPAPLPEHNATIISGKTGTRTQGTLPRPQLSRLLHYHSATFPRGGKFRPKICLRNSIWTNNWYTIINLPLGKIF